MKHKSNRDGAPDRERARIADLAARIVDEGESDYRAAAQKAAKQLGLGRATALPDANEIDQALRQRQALFAADSQPQALQQLRRAALTVMRELEPFAPWLVGSVLAGTANEFSDIEIELIGVEPKQFEMYLLGRGIDFEATDEGGSPRRATHAPLARYALSWRDVQIAIVLFEHHAARQAIYPPGHLRHERLQHAEAAKRFG